MIKIINGIEYNTDASKKLGERRSRPAGADFYRVEELYATANGNCFIHGYFERWCSQAAYENPTMYLYKKYFDIDPITEEEAKQFKRR